MTINIIIILILSGVFVGFINTLSAGGTTISIALYLAFGIPATTTNAINRVGVLIQNGFASIIFSRKHIINYKHIFLYSLPVMLGAFIGSLIAVKISETTFNICFAIVLLLMIVFLFLDKKKYDKQEQPFTLKRYFIAFPFFLLSGFYGGFVQAGTGFLLIATVGTILGYDLIKTTASKNAIMFLYTLIALCVFFVRGGVETKYWIYGLIHSIGNIIGSFIAAKYAIKKGSSFVKAIIVTVIIITAFNLFGLINISSFFKNFLK